MAHRRSIPLLILVIYSVAAAPVSSNHNEDLVNGSFPIALAELHEVVDAIADDVMRTNIEGLQKIHLESDKFSKFGPRNFDRQNVAETKASEAAFFGSVSDVDYRINDLKIDVFGEIGIVTYYPQVSFTKQGERKQVKGRQTLVFLRTNDGWKIVHEHGTVRPQSD